MIALGKIMVVADQERLLEPLRALFSDLPLRADIHFFANTSEAQAAAAEQPFQVVFAELETGAGQTASLLKEFWKIRPQMVRFLVAPSLDGDLMVECVVNAHHYLKSPLDLAELKAALDRAACIDRLVRNDRIQSLVSRMRTLPSRPTLYLEVLRELRSARASAHAVGELVGKDLGISMKLIQVVNSAFYGLAQKVDEPSAAVFLLGLETTASLVLSIEAFSRFDKVKPLYFSTDRVWRHSQSVAHAARRIAETMSNDPELVRRAFTAGLVHDIGKLALALNFEDQYQGALKLAEKKNLAPCEVEAEVFGATHAETGAYLLSLWGLPLPIVEAVAGHHLPAAETGGKFTVLTALHLAERLHSEQEQLKNGVAAPKVDLEYPSELQLAPRMDEFRLMLGARESQDIGATIMTRAQLKAAPVPVNVAAVPAPLIELQPRAPRTLRPRNAVLAACVLGVAALLGVIFTFARSSQREEARHIAAEIADFRASNQASPKQISSLLGESTSSASAPALANSAELRPEPDPIAKLKLQAIIYNGPRSAMVIDGRAFRLGDEISGAKIVAVQPEEVVLEKLGAQHRLRLR